MHDFTAQEHRGTEQSTGGETKTQSFIDDKKQSEHTRNTEHENRKCR